MVESSEKECLVKSFAGLKIIIIIIIAFGDQTKGLLYVRQMHHYKAIPLS